MHTPPRTTYHGPLLTPSPLRVSHKSQFHPRPMTPENSDAAVFLAPQPLLTPAKPVLSRIPLSLNTNTHGTKRKSSPHTSTTTPLRLAPPSPGATFHRLAPLPAPQFSTRTPQTVADADTHLRSHTATLTRLRITDLKDEFDDDEGLALPVLSRAEEVVEASSPGGHITKRRARSRPVSQELLEGSPSPVEFPARPRTASNASSSENGSPLPRRRLVGATRAPLERIESAATLFFGPAINPPPSAPRSRLPSATASLKPTNPLASNRHSYAGPGCNTQSWNEMQTRAATPSPGSSPGRVSAADDDEDQDMEMFFAASLPEPLARPVQPVATIPKKYHPRDLSDDDVDHPMPQASTSVNSLYSDDGLVTPGIDPEPGSRWPTVASGDPDDMDVDEFIQRTLATGAKTTAASQAKKAPGTPVKRVKTSYLVVDRPWQSAVAHKVGLPDFEPKNGKPRKSLPAVFPAVGRKAANANASTKPDVATDSEGEDESPSGHRDKYVGLGMGRPIARTKWLSRRTSSGAFSSGSDTNSLAGTPTRVKDWHLPKTHRPIQFSPSNNALNLSPGRSASSSSSASMGSPTGARYMPDSHSRVKVPLTPRPANGRRLSDQAVERVGYFERSFEELDELGSGEFGKVIKVRSRSRHGEYAVKKSKRFEGVRHRLRLREEVEILQHLTCGGVQPNVLTFVDSWEEDDVLYIQTELCALGNFAHFLWEYGRTFPRLDEARIWKILVELSNGLRFIHGCNVIHLDLKPSNIFVTDERRLKIGDFGMASVWPRTHPPGETEPLGFEREGDKMYLAPEVLQGRYGKAADVFSFGMTMLETASNIVVPDQGDSWLRLRQEDFSQIEMDDMPELFELIRAMLRTEPEARIDIEGVCEHAVVSRARAAMGEGGALDGSGTEFVGTILA
ncbi:hypothetical protein HMN09_00773100 [Mycena chlorophos]|uniref:Protein kinase domain-containing protein n=1 Tax=Mycena chlorophos TaxID=658473 RepID=A0A8H6SUL2_MYCCL|nr:hypothetical protein HMN09_00773100 [Mycena chlorophos]